MDLAFRLMVLVDNFGMLIFSAFISHDICRTDIPLLILNLLMTHKGFRQYPKPILLQILILSKQSEIGEEEEEDSFILCDHNN